MDYDIHLDLISVLPNNFSKDLIRLIRSYLEPDYKKLRDVIVTQMTLMQSTPWWASPFVKYAKIDEPATVKNVLKNIDISDSISYLRMYSPYDIRVLFRGFGEFNHDERRFREIMPTFPRDSLEWVDQEWTREEWYKFCEHYAAKKRKRVKHNGLMCVVL